MPLAVLASLVLSSAPSTPAAPEAAQAPQETRPTLTPQQAAAEYEQRVLFFEDYSLVSPRTGARVGKGSDIYQGKYKREVEPGEFFELVGRQDLADRYRSKTRLRNGLWLGGLGLTVASMAAGVILSATTEISTGGPVGIIGGTAGIGLVFGGFFVNTQVAPLHEMREMADGYNTRLRDELGVQPGQTPVNTVAPVQQVRLMPYVGGSGAGLTLGGRF